MKRWQICIHLEGLNLSRLIWRAGESGIRLTRMCQMDHRTLLVRIREDDLPRMRGLAERGGWQLTFIRREGMGHIRDVAVRRWFLAVSALLLLLAASLGTRVMWAVDVIDAGAYTQDIRQYLAQSGVVAPMPRKAVDPATLKASLEWRYPAVAWFECGWRGMRLVIRAVEGTMPKSAQSAGACDVIAERDGVVQQVITRSGTPQVKPGDLVHNGDVLIRGAERTKDGGEQPVRASGSVIARVWETAAVQMPLRHTETDYTGKTLCITRVTCPWFDFWQEKESVFQQEDVHTESIPLSSWFLPVCIVKETHMEAVMRSKAADPEQLKAEAREAALRILYEKAGGRDSIIDNWVNWSIIEDEILLSEAIGEMLTDIARPYPSGMTAPE